MIASGTMDEKRQITYQTFLFTIMYALLFLLGRLILEFTVLTKTVTAVADSTRTQRSRNYKSLWIQSSLNGATIS